MSLEEKMELDIYVVDAFTSELFKGNSAAVVLLEEWLDDGLMQNIAIENNLSETAFACRTAENCYDIRWFSPITEIDFCGHATLATSYVLYFELGLEGTIEFTTTKVGKLTVSLNSADEIEMSFPNHLPELVSEVPDGLIEGLSIAPKLVLRNRQAYFAIYENESDIHELTYNSEQLKTLAPFDVVVSAKGELYDFVSRYFWPANGGDEDPVTGSIHSGLTPYWSNVLGIEKLTAYQASRRGGVLKCTLENERVIVAGKGTLYLKGTIFV